MKKLKRILASLMVVIMILTTAPLNGFVGIELPDWFNVFASAATYSGTCGDNLTWSLDTETGELVISGEGEMDDYCTECYWESYSYNTIKSITINEGVTSIGKYAFSVCKSLTSITIPDSVTSIGDVAFEGCTSLTSITIPVSVTSIGSSAFYYCTSLTSITIPDSVTSIGSSAFYNCTSLTSITIPDSVTSIGNSVFAGCKSLTSITIPDSVISIGSYAFSGCTSLTSVTIGNGVTSIDNYAFYNCSGIKELTMPVSAKINSEYIFDGCANIESITLTKGNGTVHDYTNSSYTPWYDSRDSLKEVVIEDGVTSIGDSAFEGCTSLTSITIPDSVTSIGSSAFYWCDSLTSITIPDGVTSIGNYTFYNCSGLIELTMPISAKIYNSSYTFGGCTNIERITLTKGNGTVQNYYENSNSSGGDTQYLYTPWYISKCPTIIIEDGVEAIGNYMFYNHLGFTNITLPESISGVGLYAFGNCSGLTDVYYNGDIAGWCSIEFSNGYANPMCSGENLYIDGALIEGDIVLPDGTARIGSYAFLNCDELTSVTVPDSVTSIGESVFLPGANIEIVMGAESDVKLYLVKGSCVELYAKNNGIIYYYIDDGTDENLISVVVTPKLSFEINKETYTMTVNCIGNMISFTNADAPWYQYRGYIKHIVINDGCNNISDSAFKNMGGLESIVIPGSVTSIGDYAFYDCFTLTSVTIPDSVTSIGDYAFYDCFTLISVTIPDSVTSIGSYAFYYCTNLTNVTIGNSVTSIGDYAFYCCSGIKELTMPVSVKIYSNTFYSCYNIKKITLTKGNGTAQDYGTSKSSSVTRTYYGYTPWYISRSKELTIEDGVTGIGSYTFYDCYSLTSITIPDSVRSIDSCAFSDCTSLTSVTIGNGVTSIGNSAFNGCTSLISITIPDSVTSIGDYAFQNCSGLADVSIGDGVTSIGSYAFAGCTGITDITVGNNVKSINANAFNGCTSLENITLPFALQSIGDNAFTGCSKLEKLKVYSRNCSFGTECISYITTICGYADSTAETYADEVGYFFELIPDDDHEHIYSNNCDAECNLCGYVNPDAGHTYDNDCDAECNYCDFVRTPNHTDDNNDGLCDVCEKALSDILVGVTQNFKVKAGETVYIKFVPANSGVYTFYSSSSADTYGYIFDVNKNQLASDDDSSGNGNNFSITYTFKSGTVYYLGVRYYSSSNSGEIPVTIRLDELICDHNHTHEEHQDSTCAENGYDKVICDDCGNTISDETLPLAEHDIKTDVFEPTCEEAGAKISYCKQCSYAYVAEHLAPLGHSELVWVTVKVPSTRNEGIMNQVCPACGEVFDTKTVPAISLSVDSTANIDFETNTITGFDSGSTSIGDFLSATNNGYTFTCESEKIGTGTVITLTAGDDMINEFEAVIFGDTNGDGWYDGQDAIIVDCLANGMLTKEDVGEAVYMAADCNHDGVIDQLDVALLNQAGALLANVDQSKPTEVLLETSSEYVEYLSLIDQSPEIEIEDETETDTDVETIPEQDEVAENVSFFEVIMDFIRSIIEMILAYIPVAYK